MANLVGVLPSIKQRIQAQSHRVAAAGFLAALAVTLAFGRWGSYLRGPIPDIYLADTLLVLSLLLTVLTNPRLVIRSYRRNWPVVAVVVFPAAWALIQLVSQRNPAYLVLRDSAPFLYLSLVPAIAVAARHVRAPVITWIMRWASLTSATLWALSSFGIFAPQSSLLLGSPDVQLWTVRSDFAAVVSALGFVVWGSCGGLRARPAIQVLLGSSIALSYSRSGWIAGLLVVVLTLAYYWGNGRRLQATWLFGGVIIGITLITFAVLQAGASEQPVARSPHIVSAPVSDTDSSWSNLPEETGPTSALFRQTQTFESGDGTLMARLDTWRLILQRQMEESKWSSGFGPGGDGLIYSCTGLPAYEATGLKCPVANTEVGGTLRDPHSWLFQIQLYFGIIGLVSWVILVGYLLRQVRATSAVFLPAVMYSTGILVAGLASVLLTAPFALIPWAVLLGSGVIPQENYKGGTVLTA